jgi:GNAT superfamily N-acetyltransferase
VEKSPAVYVVRAARESDSVSVARLHRLVVRACLPYLPELHTPEDDLDYFASVVFPEGDVWVADAGEVVGYCAAPPGWVRHLYVHPSYQRNGIGLALLNAAMDSNEELQLWTFARNETARSFYAKHGFREIGGTDGDNEEKEPDVLMRWMRSWPA